MSHRQQDVSERVVRRAVDLGIAELVADPDRPDAWTLLVDDRPQSHIDLADPARLEFRYVRHLGHLIDLAAPAGAPLRVLHLGGGGLTLARYVAATRAGSSQLAVELDGALAAFVRERLPLEQRGRRAGGGRVGWSQPGRIRVRVADARAALEQLPAGSFDIVIADLFDAGRTPAHLASAQFAGAIAAVLSPAGICGVNIGDGPPLSYTRARLATLRAVFPQACLMADAAVLNGRRFGNLVVAASRQSLPADGLARRLAGDPLPVRLLGGAELDRFIAGARPITDESAGPAVAAVVPGQS